LLPSLCAPWVPPAAAVLALWMSKVVAFTGPVAPTLLIAACYSPTLSFICTYIFFFHLFIQQLSLSSILDCSSPKKLVHLTQKKTVYSWCYMTVIDHDFVKTAVDWAIRQTMTQWPKILRFCFLCLLVYSIVVRCWYDFEYCVEDFFSCYVGVMDKLNWIPLPKMLIA
jgi:hypothetical protein